MSWSKYLNIPNFLRISGDDVEGVLSSLNLMKGSAALDIGSGYGRIAIFLKIKDYNVTTCDSDPYILSLLRKKGLDAIRMDARDLKFKGDSFDLVVTDGLLEHYKDTMEIKKIISEEIRVSKKFVINFVPSDIFINSILEIIQRVPKEYRYHDWASIHKEAMNGKYKLRKVKLKRLDAYIIEK